MNQKVKKVVSLSVFLSLSLVSLSFAAYSGTPYSMPDQVMDVLSTGVNWLTLIAGTLAVIFIIVGGINFMTAAGDPAKVKLARDMILYAFVGIILVAIAQVFKQIASSIGVQMSGTSL